MGLVRLEPRHCQGHFGLVVGILIHLQIEGKGIRVQIKGFGFWVIFSRHDQDSVILIFGIWDLGFGIWDLGFGI